MDTVGVVCVDLERFIVNANESDGQFTNGGLHGAGAGRCSASTELMIAGYCPFHTGSRFSANALAPSS